MQCRHVLLLPISKPMTFQDLIFTHSFLAIARYLYSYMTYIPACATPRAPNFLLSHQKGTIFSHYHVNRDPYGNLPSQNKLLLRPRQMQ